MNETERLARRINTGMDRMFLLFFIPAMLLGAVILGMIPGIVVGTYLGKPLGVVVGFAGVIVVLLRLARSEQRRRNG